MTPAQCKSARSLVGWSQERLANESLVSVSTVRNFERRRGAPQQSTLALMSRALEGAGIEFINGDEPGVKLKKK